MANRKKEKTLTRITISVDPDDYASMELLAENSRVSTSWLIRQAMREFLERLEGGETINISLGDAGSGRK
ncbi:ribbon-helix-helix domain-containing protein [Methylocaldum sp. RMAD-M]|jgi:predicted transcriptional regulator|uniref:ribbon-helix-helix domain-containing protein n=1 Tax=Methylocaldum sp. RMAD-M TaxID=2806557 RepID=UPI001AE64498|nr:ribbon-helix-helix domain-containing protein [Methylocaldum sp. RMAD-M]MBP1151805.1 putative transcriptional regulator [Methylocaldum sp. RMAD-M]